MKRIAIAGPYDVRIEDVPVPVPGPQMLLIKTEISGISAGTEMMLYRGTFPNFKLKKWPQWQNYPVMPGYESVGMIVDVGKGASDSKGGDAQIDSLSPAGAVLKTDVSEFKVGDRVICLGEHAEYVCLPAVFAAKIPDHVTSAEATLAVLTTTSMHAIRRAEIDYGDTVAVIGMGVLGFLTMQHAKNAGTRRVVALDLDNSRLAIAKNAGADLCVNPGAKNPAEAIKRANDGILADVVIEASGFKGTEQLACDLVRDRGRVVFLGWHTDNLDLMFGDVIFKELTLLASQAIGPEAGLPYSYVRWGSDQSLKWAIELVASGKIKGCFTPTKFRYEEIGRVYQMIEKHDPAVGLQTILTW